MKKIIDCTLRDGGYHTKWNFKKEFLDSYFNLLKLNTYLEAEIGYKRHSLSVDDSSLGKLAFCNRSFLNYLKTFNLKNKLWIMLDVKELKELGLSASDYLDNLSILQGSLKPVNSIRLAVSLENLNYAISLSKELIKPTASVLSAFILSELRVRVLADLSFFETLDVSSLILNASSLSGTVTLIPPKPSAFKLFICSSNMFGSTLNFSYGFMSSASSLIQWL